MGMGVDWERIERGEHRGLVVVLVCDIMKRYQQSISSSFAGSDAQMTQRSGEPRWCMVVPCEAGVCVLGRGLPRMHGDEKVKRVEDEERPVGASTLQVPAGHLRGVRL